jgi:hypothetical protein
MLARLRATKLCCGSSEALGCVDASAGDADTASAPVVRTTTPTVQERFICSPPKRRVPAAEAFGPCRGHRPVLVRVSEVTLQDRSKREGQRVGFRRPPGRLTRAGDGFGLPSCRKLRQGTCSHSANGCRWRSAASGRL